MKSHGRHSPLEVFFNSRFKYVFYRVMGSSALLFGLVVSSGRFDSDDGQTSEIFSKIPIYSRVDDGDDVRTTCNCYHQHCTPVDTKTASIRA